VRAITPAHLTRVRAQRGVAAILRLSYRDHEARALACELRERLRPKGTTTT
jgi:hypothetical protein